MWVKRAFDRLEIKTLKGRLRCSFLCLIILLVALASIPFVFFGKHQKREDAILTIETTLDLQQLVIESWFKGTLSDIQSIAQLPAFKRSDLANMEDAMRAFEQNHAEFSGMVFVNKDGLIEIDTSGPTGLDVSDRPYFLQAKNGNSYVTDVLIGRQSNQPIIIFSAPVYNDQSIFQGLVFGSIPVASVNSVLEQVRDDTRETYMLSRDGMLITASRQGEVGKQVDSKLYEQAIQGKDLHHQFYEAPNGDSVLGEYRWVYGNRWLIISEMTEETIYQPFYRMAVMFAGITAFVLLIAYLSMIWIANQIERPIQNVLRGTREIGNGNYSYRLQSDVYIGCTKELIELCEKFNDMAELIESHMFSMAKSEERFRMITEYSSDMITMHDSAGTYIYVSPAGKEILQYDDSEMIGHDSYHFIHPEDQPSIQNNHHLLFDKGYVVSTYRIRRKDGEYIWFESSIKLMEGNNPDEPQLLVISRNITDRKLAEQKLQEANELLHELSMKDGLTGIWNRRAFDEQLDVEWNLAVEAAEPLSMIMLDIDFFKPYNDTYGHQVGDDCLRKVAKAIETALLRPKDMAFKYGGEEFVILLPNTDLSEASQIAEQIRKAVAHLQIPHAGSAIEKHITISLGIATKPAAEQQSKEQFIETADRALYKAKQDGRNCVRFL